jgi:hypothetical protein
MRIVPVFAAAAVLACLASGSARADDGAGKPPSPPPGATPPKSDPAKSEKDAKDAQKPATPTVETRIDRAKKLLRELEISLAAARAAEPRNADLVQALEQSVEIARALAKPITLAELSDEERKAVVEEAKKQIEATSGKDGNGGNGSGGPFGGWQESVLTKAFEDVEVSEEEQIKAREIISKWFKDTGAARMEGDSKRVSDLKRERDEKLATALGKKKAQKVINNLNGLSSWPKR